VTPMTWTFLLVLLVGYVGATLWLLRRGGGQERVQDCRFVCPRLEEPVNCRILQDVRIGQWIRVESCSAFPAPQQLTCDRECIRLLNLGNRLPSPAA